MRISTIAAFMIVTTLILSSCGQDRQAQVEDHSTQSYASRSLTGNWSYQPGNGNIVHELR